MLSIEWFYFFYIKRNKSNNIADTITNQSWAQSFVSIVELCMFAEWNQTIQISKSCKFLSHP